MKFKVGEMALLARRRTRIGRIPLNSLVEVVGVGHWNAGDRVLWVDGYPRMVELEAQVLIRLPGTIMGAAVMEWQLKKVDDPDATIGVIHEQERET